MNQYLIVTEGIADAIFVREYLHSLAIEGFKKSELSKSKIKQITKDLINGKTDILDVFTNPIVDIMIMGGCTKIKDVQQDLLQHSETKKILMIQDADDKTKPYGSFTKRMEYLEEQKTKFGLTFETFLFPDNQNDGDLETLLMSIKSQEKYEQFFSCYQNYINCLKSYSRFENEYLNYKSLVYSFIASYEGQELAKEVNRNYQSDIWNLKSEYLEPLKNFLLKYIKL